MTDLADLIEAVVDATELDYVGIDRLHTVVNRDGSHEDAESETQTVASVLDALLNDPRVVVVEASDMLTPVEANVGARYLAATSVSPRALWDGEFAWVMDRGTWERDRARRSAEADDGSASG
ncbi:MAG: hypothetical protein QOE05_2508 [Actinomycetota bacterium]|nr:hypothetical protein [Actinomycetota bacterium]